MRFTKRYIKKKIIAWFIGIITSSALAFFAFLFCFIGIVVALTGEANSNSSSSSAVSTVNLPAEVEAYRSTMTQVANQYEMGEYVDLLLAIMAQESGGRGKDPMQSSESGYNTRYPRSPNTIQDPMYSIECGVQAFRDTKNAAQVKSASDEAGIHLALQAYNFGGAYIPYAQMRGGYSPDNAKEFSVMMASKMGWLKYGDIDYVPHVMRYYRIGDETEIGNGVATGTFTWPTPGFNNIGRGFGTPDSATTRHRGLDINGGGINGARIVAIDGGTVTVAKYGHYSWGNYVKINHGNGYASLYAHASSLAVSQGDKVSAGQVIAFVGSTGNSTGPHLHLELELNGVLIDAAPYLKR